MSTKEPMAAVLLAADETAQQMTRAPAFPKPGSPSIGHTVAMPSRIDPGTANAEAPPGG